ncbi:MAG: family 16 glycosylhydrolase [Pseudomonadota bacterium]
MHVFKPSAEARGGRSLFAMTAKLVGIFIIMMLLINRLAELKPEPVIIVTTTPKSQAAKPIEPQRSADRAPSPEQVHVGQNDADQAKQPSGITQTAISPNAFFADLRAPFDPLVWKPNQHHNRDPGTHYGGPWRPENVVQQADNLALVVRAGNSYQRPTMGGLRTHDRFSYGRYEAIMRPSGERGVVSAFFTYTGPSFGTPHDEVDIEFTGNRPNYIEFNYFDAGIRGAYQRVKLDFDASKRMRLYAFDWLPNEIVWYVEGKEVYRTPRDRTDIPSHPSKVMISAWTGSKRVEKWTGRADFGALSQADFACVSFTPLNETSRSCAELYASDPQFRAAG